MLRLMYLLLTRLQRVQQHPSLLLCVQSHYVGNRNLSLSPPVFRSQVIHWAHTGLTHITCFCILPSVQTFLKNKVVQYQLFQEKNKTKLHTHRHFMLLNRKIASQMFLPLKTLLSMSPLSLNHSHIEVNASCLHPPILVISKAKQ